MENSKVSVARGVGVSVKATFHCNLNPGSRAAGPSILLSLTTNPLLLQEDILLTFWI